MNEPNEARASPSASRGSVSRRAALIGSAGAAVVGIAGIAAGIGVGSHEVPPAPGTVSSRQRFANKVVMITGGTSGIGRVAAIAFAREGAHVTLCGRREALGREVERGIGATGGTARYFRADVRVEADVQRFVEFTASQFGRLDVAFNNAGITRDGTMRKMSRVNWDQVLDTNLGGCFNMCKAAWEGMLARGFGRVVNIGSINGQAGQYGQVNYAAAKSGIHGFTKALAQEGAPKGITVNAIAPGYIDTDMVAAVPPEVLDKIKSRIPVGRLGKADEIARGVLFLVADDAGFVTGSTMSINGGQHMY